MNLQRRNSIQHSLIRILKDVINVEIQNTKRDLDVQPERPNANIAKCLVILVACATGNKRHIRRETDHLRPTN